LEVVVDGGGDVVAEYGVELVADGLGVGVVTSSGGGADRLGVSVFFGGSDLGRGLRDLSVALLDRSPDGEASGLASGVRLLLADCDTTAPGPLSVAGLPCAETTAPATRPPAAAPATPTAIAPRESGAPRFLPAWPCIPSHFPAITRHDTAPLREDPGSGPVRLEQTGDRQVT
jgi:hypothetical protein